ncbi:MAG: hypothetical protein JNJ50_19245 [Acidobacteria bacterium]|nr:hypothetical protein [Acidobacteriota bacterium]
MSTIGAKKIPMGLTVKIPLERSLYASEQTQRDAQDVSDRAQGSLTKSLFKVGGIVVGFVVAGAGGGALFGGVGAGPGAIVGLIVGLGVGISEVVEDTYGNVKGYSQELKQIQEKSQKEAEEAAKKQKEAEEAAKKQKEEEEAAEKQKEEEKKKEQKEKEKEKEKGYYDPNVDQGGNRWNSDPKEIARTIEAKLNSNRTPANTNRGPIFDADALRGYTIKKGELIHTVDDMDTVTLAITASDIEIALANGGGCPMNPSINPLIDVSGNQPENPHGGDSPDTAGMRANFGLPG